MAAPLRVLAFLALVASAAVAGCTDVERVPTRLLEDGFRTSYQTYMMKNITTGGATPTFSFEGVVVENATAWRSFLQRHRGNPDAVTPYTIDWTREFAVAVFLGDRGLTGWDIDVRRILWEDETYWVDTLTTAPDPYCHGRATTVYPYEIWAAQRMTAASPIPVFQFMETTQDCAR